MAKLRVKRGTDAERIGVIFEVGEPIFTTDTKRLYVGDGQTSGGIAAGILTNMMTFRGAWNSGDNYTEHDVVFYMGNSWLCLTPTSVVRPQAGVYWSQIAEKGDQGVQGLKGDTGLGFAVKKTYQSVALLLADTSPSGIVNGEFGLVNTIDPNDVENSRLYLWNSGWVYTTDLSGVQGIKGDQGFKGLQWRGSWVVGNTYIVDDVVILNGSSYISKTAGNIGNSPNSSPTNWDLIVQKGDKGDTGAKGWYFKGIWSAVTTYAIADAVTYNGSTFYALLPSTNVVPAESSVWTTVSSIGSRGMTYKGAWQTGTQYLTADAVNYGGTTYICNTDNTSATINASTAIPVMTSASAPSGLVAADSSFSSSFLPFQAFDGNIVALWNSAVGAPPHWISYQWTLAKVIARYSINTGTHQSQGPKSWTLQGWNGSSWVILDTRTNIVWTTSAKQTFDLAIVAGYTSYRLYITDAISVTGEVIIHEIEMFEMPGANVPTNPLVWDVLAQKGDIGKTLTISKVYTSQAALLADTNPTNIQPNEYAIISTNAEDPDNAKMYRWSGSLWIYLADLSGFSAHNSATSLQGGSVGERYHVTLAEHDGLTQGLNTILHHHSQDRDRSNHTGTQLASTISDFTVTVQAIPTDGGYF